MNVLSSLLLRRTRTQRTVRAVLATALIFAFGGFGVFAASNAYAAGTIQIAGSVAPNNNNPHQGCTLYVEFFGYDAGTHDAEVQILGKNPAGQVVATTPASGAGVTSHFTGTGGGFNDALTYEVNPAGLNEKTPGSGEYLVDVNVYTDSDIGAHKISDQKTITVEGCNDDLAVDKAGPTAGTVGGSGSYTIDVTNVGPDRAPGPITVTDAVQAGETVTAASGTGWVCTAPGGFPLVGPGTVTCVRAADLGPGGTSGTAAPTITVSVSWTASGTLRDTATVSGPRNDLFAGNDSDFVDTVVPAVPVVVPDLVQLKSGTRFATVGDTGSYLLSVRNDGDATTQALTVTDTLPAGVELVAGNPPTGTNWTCTTATSAPQVSCTQTAGNTGLAAGATSSTITVPVHFLAGSAGTATDSAHVSTVTGETDTADNTKTFDTFVTPLPTATVVKTNDASGDGQFNQDETTVTPGKTVPFRLHITNTTPYAVDVVSVSDAVDGAVTGTPVTCLPALTLAAGASGDCSFTVESYSPADGLNKTDIATVNLREAQVSEESSPSLRRKALVAVGLLTGSAKSNVATVRTRVPFVPPPPAGPTQVAAVAPSATQSVCANGAATTPSYTVPTTTGVVYTPAVGGPAVAGSTVTVTAAAAPGFVLTGPSAFTLAFAPAPDCTVPGEDLGLSKTGPGTATPGDELVYTLDVTNVKGTPATAFTVTDTLPNGLSFVSAAGTDFTCAAALRLVITCTYAGSLAVGQSAQIVVRVLLLDTFQGTTVTNTAVVDPGRLDTDATNNTDTVSTDVLVPITGGGGGGATAPTPGPSPSPSVEPTAGGGGPLPFTGTPALSLLQTGVGLLLVGLMMMLFGRSTVRRSGLVGGPQRGRHRRR